MNKAQETIDKIKGKALEFAREHATNNAKAFYLMGKKDAACTFLAMIREDGLTAIVDVANQVLKHDPENQNAKWILENSSKFNLQV